MIAAFFLIGTLLQSSGPCLADGIRAVTELFTAQGCPNCLAANKVLNDLGRQPDILALTFPVTYFDEEGWTDPNAQPAFTDRQVAYDGKLGPLVPTAPQIVINGRATSTGVDREELKTLLERNVLKPAVASTVDAARIILAKGDAPLGGADVWVVGYSPDVENTVIGAGRNIGRTIGNAGLVRSLKLIGHWSGERMSFEVPGAASLKQAVLIQTSDGGPILAAITLPDRRSALAAASH